MKLKTLASALALAFLLNIGTAPMTSDVAFAAKKEAAAKPEVLEKTLSGRTNPAAKIGGKVSKLLQKATKLSESEKIEEPKRYIDAIAILDQVLAMPKLTPYELSKAQQIKASFAYNADQIPMAIEAANAAVKGNGLNNVEHLQTMMMVTQLLYQNEQYDESIKAFDAYVAEAPKIKGSDYVMQASNYYNQDKFKETVAFIDKALASGDEPQKAWYQLKANSLYQAEDYKAAAAYLKELMAKDPKEKQWVNLAASSYISEENYTEALNVLQTAKKNGLFDSPEMWKQLFGLYQNAERYVDAANTIEEAVAAGGLKRDASTMNSLGQNLYTAAQDLDGKPEAKPLLERAEKAFKEAIALDPADGTADVWMGQLNMFERDNQKAARDHLAAAVTKKVSQIGNAYYLLGVAEFNLGNMAPAKAALTKALGYPESKSNATAFMKNLK
jgi:hypothetical protein